MPSFESLSGQSNTHIASFKYGSVNALIHPDMGPAVKILAAAAKKQGFKLKVVSGFRSYDQQLAVWNAKARGERPVLDILERPIRHGTLNGWPLVEAILRWSALPGASRHHWGSDIDVVDGAALTLGYKIQLTQKEAAANGIFGAFHRWLSQWLLDNPQHGFTRPYHHEASAAWQPLKFGIAPEPWHLSYRPVAEEYEKAFDLGRLAQLIERSDIELKSDILANMDEINDRFVTVRT